MYLDAVHEEVALPSSNQEAVFEGTDVLDGEGQLEKLVDAVCGVHDAGCSATDGQVVVTEKILFLHGARSSPDPSGSSRPRGGRGGTHSDAGWK